MTRNAGNTIMRLNADTFNVLYQKHAARAEGFFLRMTGYDRCLAQDLTQELFTRLWEHRKSYDPDKPFTTWMFSAAYNLCKNKYRHDEVIARWREEYIQTHDDVCNQDSDNSEERMRIVNDAVQTLPAELREVMLLRYYEGLSIKETTEILGIPEGTVKSRAFTALNEIKNSIEI